MVINPERRHKYIGSESAKITVTPPYITPYTLAHLKPISVNNDIMLMGNSLFNSICTKAPHPSYSTLSHEVMQMSIGN